MSKSTKHFLNKNFKFCASNRKCRYGHWGATGAWILLFLMVCLFFSLFFWVPKVFAMINTFKNSILIYILVCMGMYMPVHMCRLGFIHVWVQVCVWIRVYMYNYAFLLKLWALCYMCVSNQCVYVCLHDNLCVSSFLIISIKKKQDWVELGLRCWVGRNAPIQKKKKKSWNLKFKVLF